MTAVCSWLTSVRRTLVWCSWLLLPSLAWAQQEGLLRVSSTFTPAVSFTQTYAEKLVRDPDFGPQPVPAATTKLKLAASLHGVDLSALESGTELSVELGSLLVPHTLGDDPAWAPGRTTATFPLVDETVDPPKKVGTLVYAWTAEQLTVTLTSTDFTTAAVVDPSAYEDGPVADTFDATIIFGADQGTHSVPFTGSRRTTTATADDEEFDLVSGSFSGEAVYTGPKLSFVSPKPAVVRTTTDTLPLTVQSNGLQVYYTLNDGEPTTLESASAGQWSGELTLEPGPNHLEVFAEGETPEELSAIGKDFFYVVTVPVTVEISGSGSITPAALVGTTPQEQGVELILTAKPARGFVFAGWSGDVESAEPTLKFTVTPELQLAANFVPNPFGGVTGTFQAGFAGPDAEGITLAGRLLLTTTPSGAFTGQLQVRGATVPLQGRLSVNGSVELTVPGAAGRPALRLQVLFAVVEEGGAVGFAGTLTDLEESFSVDLEGHALIFSKAHPVPASQRGLYTLVLRQPAEEAPGPEPAVLAYATARVSAAGAVVLSGRYVDGGASRPFSGSARLAEDFSFPLYAELRVKGKPVRQGALAGTLTLGEPDDDGPAPLDGTAYWYAQLNSVDGTQPPELLVDRTLTVAGARFLPPKAGRRVLPGFQATRGAATFQALDEEGQEILTRRLRLPAAGPAVGLPLVVQPGRGLFTGKFAYPEPRGQAKLRGVFLMRENRGVGFFTLPQPQGEPARTGTVLLSPEEPAEF